MPSIYWMPLGVVVGVAIGAALDDVPVGIAAGAGIGGALYACFEQRG